MLTKKYIIKNIPHQEPLYTVRDHLPSEYYKKINLEKSKRKSKLEEKANTQKLNN